MKFPSDFFEALKRAYDFPWIGDLEETVRTSYASQVHGDTERWEFAMESLPDLGDIRPQLNTSGVGFMCKGASRGDVKDLESALRAFHPWRKGPFQLGDVFIDTEWRSDWKWDRLRGGIEPLAGKTVLDIGCGSGYHLWRMMGEGASLALGLEPVDVYVYQFAALQRYLSFVENAAVLRIPFEPFPQNTHFFDTIFSMGVLYHRKSPLEHLEMVRESLQPGGQLVLETLVIEGDENTVLVPAGRYAQMRNVWFLPSVETLVAWLKRLRFRDVRVVDVNRTTVEEQRTTDWMQFDSLKTFLHPDDPSQTVEGYSSPLRAIITART